MSIKDIPCPHGWSDCNSCLHEDKCRLGLYEAEELEPSNIEEIAKICEKQMQKEVVESVRIIKERNAVKAYDGMNRFYSFRNQHINHKEPMPPGYPAFGGESKSGKRRKQPVKKLPEYLRTFGL